MNLIWSTSVPYNSQSLNEQLYEVSSINYRMYSIYKKNNNNNNSVKKKFFFVLYASTLYIYICHLYKNEKRNML